MHPHSFSYFSHPENPYRELRLIFADEASKELYYRGKGDREAKLSTYQRIEDDARTLLDERAITPSKVNTYLRRMINMALADDTATFEELAVFADQFKVLEGDAKAQERARELMEDRERRIPAERLEVRESEREQYNLEVGQLDFEERSIRDAIAYLTGQYQTAPMGFASAPAAPTAFAPTSTVQSPMGPIIVPPAGTSPWQRSGAAPYAAPGFAPVVAPSYNPYAPQNVPATVLATLEKYYCINRFTGMPQPNAVPRLMQALSRLIRQRERKIRDRVEHEAKISPHFDYWQTLDRSEQERIETALFSTARASMAAIVDRYAPELNSEAHFTFTVSPVDGGVVIGLSETLENRLKEAAGEIAERRGGHRADGILEWKKAFFRGMPVPYKVKTEYKGDRARSGEYGIAPQDAKNMRFYHFTPPRSADELASLAPPLPSGRPAPRLPAPDRPLPPRIIPVGSAPTAPEEEYRPVDERGEPRPERIERSDIAEEVDAQGGRTYEVLAKPTEIVFRIGPTEFRPERIAADDSFKIVKERIVAASGGGASRDVFVDAYISGTMSRTTGKLRVTVHNFRGERLDIYGKGSALLLSVPGTTPDRLTSGIEYVNGLPVVRRTPDNTVIGGRREELFVGDRTADLTTKLPESIPDVITAITAIEAESRPTVALRMKQILIDQVDRRPELYSEEKNKEKLSTYRVEVAQSYGIADAYVEGDGRRIGIPKYVVDPRNVPPGYLPISLHVLRDKVVTLQDFYTRLPAGVKQRFEESKGGRSDADSVADAAAVEAKKPYVLKEFALVSGPTTLDREHGVVYLSSAADLYALPEFQAAVQEEVESGITAIAENKLTDDEEVPQGPSVEFDKGFPLERKLPALDELQRRIISLDPGLKERYLKGAPLTIVSYLTPGQEVITSTPPKLTSWAPGEDIATLIRNYEHREEVKNAPETIRKALQALQNTVGAAVTIDLSGTPEVRSIDELKTYLGRIETIQRQWADRLFADVIEQVKGKKVVLRVVASAAEEGNSPSGTTHVIAISDLAHLRRLIGQMNETRADVVDFKQDPLSFEPLSRPYRVRIPEGMTITSITLQTPFTTTPEAADITRFSAAGGGRIDVNTGTSVRATLDFNPGTRILSVNIPSEAQSGTVVIQLSDGAEKRVLFDREAEQSLPLRGTLPSELLESLRDSKTSFNKIRSVSMRRLGAKSIAKEEGNNQYYLVEGVETVDDDQDRKAGLASSLTLIPIKRPAGALKLDGRAIPQRQVWISSDSKTIEGVPVFILLNGGEYFPAAQVGEGTYQRLDGTKPLEGQVRMSMERSVEERREVAEQVQDFKGTEGTLQIDALTSVAEGGFLLPQGAKLKNVDIDIPGRGNRNFTKRADIYVNENNKREAISYAIADAGGGRDVITVRASVAGTAKVTIEDPTNPGTMVTKIIKIRPSPLRIEEDREQSRERARKLQEFLDQEKTLEVGDSSVELPESVKVIGLKITPFNSPAQQFDPRTTPSGAAAQQGNPDKKIRFSAGRLAGGSDVILFSADVEGTVEIVTDQRDPRDPDNPAKSATKTITILRSQRGALSQIEAKEKREADLVKLQNEKTVGLGIEPILLPEGVEVTEVIINGKPSFNTKNDYYAKRDGIAYYYDRNSGSIRVVSEKAGDVVLVMQDHQSGRRLQKTIVVVASAEEVQRRSGETQEVRREKAKFLQREDVNLAEVSRQGVRIDLPTGLTMKEVVVQLDGGAGAAKITFPVRQGRAENSEGKGITVTYRTSDEGKPYVEIAPEATGTVVIEASDGTKKMVGITSLGQLGEREAEVRSLEEAVREFERPLEVVPGRSEVVLPIGVSFTKVAIAVGSDPEQPFAGDHGRFARTGSSIEYVVQYVEGRQVIVLQAGAPGTVRIEASLAGRRALTKVIHVRPSVQDIKREGAKEEATEAQIRTFEAAEAFEPGESRSFTIPSGFERKGITVKVEGGATKPFDATYREGIVGRGRSSIAFFLEGNSVRIDAKVAGTVEIEAADPKNPAKVYKKLVKVSKSVADIEREEDRQETDERSLESFKASDSMDLNTTRDFQLPPGLHYKVGASDARGAGLPFRETSDGGRYGDRRNTITYFYHPGDRSISIEVKTEGKITLSAFDPSNPSRIIATKVIEVSSTFEQIDDKLEQARGPEAQKERLQLPSTLTPSSAERGITLEKGWSFVGVQVVSKDGRTTTFDLAGRDSRSGQVNQPRSGDPTIRYRIVPRAGIQTMALRAEIEGTVLLDLKAPDGSTVRKRIEVMKSDDPRRVERSPIALPLLTDKRFGVEQVARPAGEVIWQKGDVLAIQSGDSTILYLYDQRRAITFAKSGFTNERPEAKLSDLGNLRQLSESGTIPTALYLDPTTRTVRLSLPIREGQWDTEDLIAKLRNAPVVEINGWKLLRVANDYYYYDGDNKRLMKLEGSQPEAKKPTEKAKEYPKLTVVQGTPTALEWPKNLRVTLAYDVGGRTRFVHFDLPEGKNVKKVYKEAGQDVILERDEKGGVLISVPRELLEKIPVAGGKRTIIVNYGGSAPGEGTDTTYEVNVVQYQGRCYVICR